MSEKYEGSEKLVNSEYLYREQKELVNFLKTKFSNINKDVLDKFSVDDEGNLLFDGKSIEAEVSNEWSDITNKPFDYIGDDFKVDENGILCVSDIGQTIQVEKLPNASVDELGKIYQYVGISNNNYTNGYFYKCELENGIYKWNNCLVQPNEQSSNYVTKKEFENHAESNVHLTSAQRTKITNSALKTDLPKNLSELNDDLGWSDEIHVHDNKTNILDKLSETDGKLTFDGALVSSSGVEISKREDNMLENVEDGLYVGTENVIVKTDKITEELITNAIDNSHSHENKTLLDSLGTKDSKLTLNGAIVGANVEISKEKNNGVQDLIDGIYVDVSSHHTHNNITQLNKIGEKDGEFTYNGSKISGVSEWNDITGKPFSTINTSDLSVSSNKLGLNYTELNKKYASKNSEHAHDNKTSVLDKLSVNDNNELMYDGSLVASSNVQISSKSGQGIVNEEDGLYVDLSPYAEKTSVANAINLAHSHSNKTVLDKVTQTMVTNSHSHSNKTILDKITQTVYDNFHKHDNKTEILDLLGKNDNGALTFNGVDVATSSVNLSAKDKNIIQFEDDGLYATVDLSPYAKTDDVKNTYAPKVDYMALASYVDTKDSKKPILGSKIKKDTLSHLNLLDIGSMTHDELELMINNHITNTQIHNTGTLNSLMIQQDEWNKGTLENFRVDADGNMGLAYYDDTKTSYTLNQAIFTSKIYDVGSVISFSNITWYGNYNPYLSNVSLYVRYGTTSVYNATTWSNWIDVTETKSLADIKTRYIQVQIKAKTADRYKDIIFKYIQIFYGENADTELADSRIALDGTVYTTLKAHLDAMETTINENTDGVEASFKTKQNPIYSGKTLKINKYGEVDFADSIIVDSELSETSENPVQNKVIYSAIGDIGTILDKINGTVV